MARILIVEDDRSIAELIRLYLRRDGHETEIIDNGAAALRRIEADPAAFDALVLDLMLPGLDGRGLCRRIRGFSDLPVIMLTALDDDRDKIEGLEIGADDYLTKPFNPLELAARVKALLRRSASKGETAASAAGETITAGNLTMHPRSRRVTIHGAEAALRSKEFDLLAALIVNAGIVLTRDQLLDHVWGGEFAGDTRTVDVHVSRLRERLTDAGADVEIATIRSVGYRLDVPPAR